MEGEKHMKGIGCSSYRRSRNPSQDIYNEDEKNA